MLLNNKWFGPILRQWEETKTLSRKTKYRVFVIIVAVFSISIAMFDEKIIYQLLLAAIAVILIILIWRINEPQV